jgi:hypothetical protein
LILVTFPRGYDLGHTRQGWRIEVPDQHSTTTAHCQQFRTALA